MIGRFVKIEAFEVHTDALEKIEAQFQKGKASTGIVFLTEKKNKGTDNEMKVSIVTAGKNHLQ